MIRKELQDVLRYAKSRQCKLDCFSRTRFSKDTYFIAVREPSTRVLTILDSTVDFDYYIRVVEWWGECIAPLNTEPATSSMMMRRVRPLRTNPVPRKSDKQEKPRPSGFGQRADEWYESQVDPTYYSGLRIKNRATIADPMVSRRARAASPARKPIYSPDDGSRG